MKVRSEILARFSSELGDIIKEAEGAGPDKSSRWLRWCRQAKANIDTELGSRKIEEKRE